MEFQGALFCYIFTSFARIEKINIDLKPPFDFDGGFGKLMQSETRRLYHGAFSIAFRYRAVVDFQMMALGESESHCTADTFCDL
jgi:hypothetical protein